MTYPHLASEGIITSDGKYVTINPLPVATVQTLTDRDRDELEAHRDGIGHLAEDPMHAGQPVHETRDSTDEPRYWLQVTHQGMPLWSCACCSKLTIGPPGWGAPERCAGCEHGTADDLSPLLYPTSVECLSVASAGASQYEGPCLIAGSDGCDC